jgi:glycosyltransferase involved in cell wall biosynthesis
VSRKDDSWFRVTEFTLRHSDWLMCDSESVRSSAQEIHPHPDDRILQLPWGVDLETFSPGKNSSPLRRTLGWDDCFVLLWTRMWEPVYGILTLLSAFAQARQRNPALRLILLGDGSLSEEVRDRISRHGIDGEIFLPGILPEDELADVFHASDAYVSCSQVDGSSVSLLQALACGLPVVVSDIPGNREWVTPGENGFLVPPGDVDGYMRALLTVSLVSRKKRSEMARLNREKAERKADWNRNIGVLFSAYERIAALTEGSTGKK